MKRTTIFIEESVEADLHALARRQQRPVAAIVREAVAQYVVSQRQALPSKLGFVGIGRSGTADTAERHDEIAFEGLTPHGTDDSAAYPTPRRRASPRRRG
jgi:hypothetical protein